ncbi:MAG: MurR/RpiR family transcriptional regulator [Sarcina sp.]
MIGLEFIKKDYNNFTEGEKKIADYLLEGSEEILGMSAKEIGERTGTSAPTVVRFSKKIGFSTLNEMKVKLAIKNIRNKKESFNYLENDLKNKSIKEVIKDSVIEITERTMELVNEEELEKGIKLLKKAKTIYIFGIGSSNLVGIDLYYKLSRINKRCIINMDSHMQITTSALVEEGDVVIAISYSGETREVLESTRNAKERKGKIITITREAIDNKLAKMADINFKIPYVEKNLREGAITSRTSQLLIADMLFLGLGRENIKKTEEKLIETRNVINKFNNR